MKPSVHFGTCSSRQLAEGSADFELGQPVALAIPWKYASLLRLLLLSPCLVPRNHTAEYWPQKISRRLAVGFTQRSTGVHPSKSPFFLSRLLRRAAGSAAICRNICCQHIEFATDSKPMVRCDTRSCLRQPRKGWSPSRHFSVSSGMSIDAAGAAQASSLG